MLAKAYLFIVVLAFMDVLFPLGIYLWGVPLLAASIFLLQAEILGILEVFFLCMIGTYAGSVSNFFLCGVLIQRFPSWNKKVEHRFLVKIETGLKSDLLLCLTLAGMRFTALSRPISGVACRLAKVPSRRFLRSELLAAFLWVFVWCCVARFLPEVVDLEGISGWVGQWVGSIEQ